MKYRTSVRGVFSIPCRRERCREEAVGHFEIRLEPFVMLAKHGHYFFDSFFIGCLVIEVELCPGKERKCHTVRIVLGENGLSRFDIVSGMNCAIGLLKRVQRVESVRRRINSIAIDEKKAGEDLLKKIESFLLRIVKKLCFADFCLAAPVCPAISNPCPSPIIDIDKILVIEVDMRKILLIQAVYPLDERLLLTDFTDNRKILYEITQNSSIP